MDQTATILQHVQTAFRLLPEKPLWAEVEELVRFALDKKRFQLAFSLAEIAVSAPHQISAIPESLINLFNFSYDLWLAQQYLHQNRYAAFLEKWQQLDKLDKEVQLRQGANLDHLLSEGLTYVSKGTEPKLQPTSPLPLEIEKELAQKTEELSFLTALFALAQDNEAIAKQIQSRKEELERAKKERGAQLVDRLLNQIERLKALYHLEDATRIENVVKNFTASELVQYLQQEEALFQQIGKHLESAKKIGPNSTQKQKIDDYQKEFDTLRQKSVSFRAPSVNKMLEGERLKLEKQWIDRLMPQLQWYQTGEEISQRMDIGVAFLQPMSQELAKQLKEFIVACYRFLVAIDREDRSVKLLLEKAKTASARVGKAIWEELSKEANEQLNQYQTDLQMAQEAFTQGDLESMAATLDSLAYPYQSDPAWSDLKTKLITAKLWQKWQTAHQSELETANYDEALLDKMEAELNQLMPAFYWKKALEYLERCQEQLRQEIKNSFSYYTNPNFVMGLRNYLRIEWLLRRLPNRTPVQNSRSWDNHSFLQAAYTNGEKKQFDQLLELIHATSSPPNIPEVLNSLTSAAWTTIHYEAQARREEEEKEKQEEEKRERKRRAAKNQKLYQLLTYLIIGVVILCIASVLTGGFVYQTDPDRWNQQLFGSYTPTSTLTPTATATSTTTPTPTPTFTPTPLPPTPTDTPTPTFTPTPIPDSGFRIEDTTAVYPRLPMASSIAWMLNIEQATVAPTLDDTATWTMAESADTNANKEPFYYTEVGNVSVSWEMDVPFNVDGLYQLYMLDTKASSAGGYTFAVWLDEQAATPYRGQSTVIFNTQVGGQTQDDWLPIGAYEVKYGQRLRVEVRAGSLTVDMPFGLDRLLIVQLPDSHREMLAELPQGRVLVSLLDNPILDEVGPELQSVFEGAWVPSLLENWELSTDPGVWNHEFLVRSAAWLPETLRGVQVNWNPVGRLPAGKYELYVRVPSINATAQVEYFLVADGEELASDTPRQLVQKDLAGQWVSLGIWDLPQEAAVGVRLYTLSYTAGDSLGIDAVALVKVEE